MSGTMGLTEDSSLLRSEPGADGLDLDLVVGTAQQLDLMHLYVQTVTYYGVGGTDGGCYWHKNHLVPVGISRLVGLLSLVVKFHVVVLKPVQPVVVGFLNQSGNIVKCICTVLGRVACGVRL